MERAETIAVLGAVPPPPRPTTPAAQPDSRSVVVAPEGPRKRCPTCGERFPVDYRVCPRDVVELELDSDDDRDPYLGCTLAQSYRIVRRIGVGGMGSVYEASHTRLGPRRLAVKIMHDELSRKGDLATRFRREAEVAELARHDNVLEVYDLDQTPAGIPFIVSELLEGEDLAQCLEREGTLSLEQTVHLVRQLCAALIVLHGVGVVHRDLKPDNVFLVGDSEAPRVKLLDFGIARLTDATGADRTRTGIVMGTPAYMAPEQARGARVDHRCDVYAVGAIVYRCLTGRPVFVGEDPAATLTAVLTREPERPRSVVPDLPETVELVIERAIAREPEERFQSMAELDAALASLVEPSPARTDDARPTEALRPFESGVDAGRVAQRARPTLVATTALGIVLVVGIIADLAARLIAYASDEGTLTRSEGLLVVVGIAAALATPAALWIRMLVTRVWPNSLRAVALARRSVATLGATATAYAAVLLVARLLDLAVSSEPSTASGLLAAIVATSAAAATAALWMTRGRPLRRRDRDEASAIEDDGSLGVVEYVPPAQTLPVHANGSQ